MKGKKIVSVAMTLALMTSMLAGCGGTGGGAGGAAGAGAGANSGKANSSAGNTDMTLTVYAGINEEPAVGLCKDFEKATGIKTSMVRMSGGEILARVKAEKNNPKASVWFGGPAESFIQAKVDNLLDTYVSPDAGDISDKYKSKDGYWTGFQTGVLGFFTNKKMLQEKGLQAPKTWDDLLKPEYKGQIVVANPASSGTAFTFIATLIQLKGHSAAMDYFKKLDAQIKEYPKTGAAPSQMTAMGECLVGIGYLHEGITQQKAGYKDIEISTPTDGTGYMVDSVALIKNGPDKAAGEKFIDWLMKKDVENSFVKYQEYQVPANKNATTPPEDSFMSSVKLINYDMQLAGTNRDKWVQDWHQVTNK